ncbi:MAG: MBL fold metallo-hydrolase [Candidatus Pacebacteria bacterium]|nr:MBL fold metallo-hydrolase [Candidatus Paceibacterota bacterium]
MIITYNGMESFKVQTGNFVLAFNPISKKSKFKPTRFGADIVCVSVDHPDFNGVEQCDSKGRNLFVIDSPGEYEIAGVFVKGFQTWTAYEGKNSGNTIYSVMLDNIHLGFLGALGANGIEGELRENLNTIDILFAPIGGIDVLDAEQAYKMSVKLGAKIIIPMHYGEAGEKDALKKFLKESGTENLKAIDKLTVKKKDLEDKTGEVVVLEINN